MGNCCINLNNNDKELFFNKDKNNESNKREDIKNMTIKKYIENNDIKNKNINIITNTKIYSINSNENEKYKSKKIYNYLNKKNNIINIQRTNINNKTNNNDKKIISTIQNVNNKTNSSTLTHNSSNGVEKDNIIFDNKINKNLINNNFERFNDLFGEIVPLKAKIKRRISKKHKDENDLGELYMNKNIDNNNLKVL